MIAHSVISPALFGVLSESMFGSKEEMEIAYKLFQENYAKYRQHSITEAFNWAWKKLNKEDLNMIFKGYILNLEQQTDETNKTSAALNGMSPLLSGKVLENLTINEIRALAQLAPIPNGDQIPSQVVPAAPTAMSADDPVLVEFDKAGRSKDEFIILSSRDYTDFSDNEDEFMHKFLRDRYDMSITDDDRNILQMIKNGESYDSISKAIGKGGVYLSKRLFLLKQNGYIDGWNLTDKGQKEAVVIAEIQVMYSYEKKPGIDGPAILPDGRTRPFCKAMVKSDKLYTREEINQISGIVDRDVWTYRGGWYHNPDTEKNTPSCRHIWKQNIVTVKK
jgi:ribosomal protein S8